MKSGSSNIFFPSAVLLESLWQASCDNADESYQMEKILDFFGKNMFSLIQNLTESNIVWITLALLSFRLEFFWS